METLSSSVSIAAAEAPVWVTVVAALITGVFALLAGAAAASLVTTSHERNERFRTRMIESAEQVVAEMDAVLEVLDRAFAEAARASNFNYDADTRLAYVASARQILEEALTLAQALDRRSARLLLIHGDPSVRDQMSEVSFNLDRYVVRIEAVLSDVKAGRTPDRTDQSFDLLEERKGYAWEQRNRMLLIFHDEIFRYGTFRYMLRRSVPRGRSSAGPRSDESQR